MFSVGNRGFWKACETNSVNQKTENKKKQKHVYSYILKINIIMNTAYLWKCLNTHSLGEDKGTDSKWNLLLHICVWRKKIISWNTCTPNSINHINDIWIRHLYLVSINSHWNTISLITTLVVILVCPRNTNAVITRNHSYIFH